jgi:dTMP kinase
VLDRTLVLRHFVLKISSPDPRSRHRVRARFFCYNSRGGQAVFITLEGIEGCGKTTQAKRLAGYLESRGLRVAKTREPGGSPIGAQLRRILLSEDYAVSPPAELLLYAAERAEHVERVIRPALDRGEWVVCDRFGDATRAYQAFGRGLQRSYVEEAHAIATGGLEPDVTFLLKIPVEEGLTRALARNGRRSDGEGRFEAESLAFHRRVAKGYDRLATEYSERIVSVDGLGDEETVAGRLVAELESRIDL